MSEANQTDHGSSSGREKVVLGSVVVLNHGGPVMTVTHIDSSGFKAVCVWFDSGLTLHSAEFHTTSLRVHRTE